MILNRQILLAVIIFNVLSGISITASEKPAEKKDFPYKHWVMSFAAGFGLKEFLSWAFSRSEKPRSSMEEPDNANTLEKSEVLKVLKAGKYKVLTISKRRREHLREASKTMVCTPPIAAIRNSDLLSIKLLLDDPNVDDFTKDELSVAKSWLIGSHPDALSGLGHCLGNIARHESEAGQASNKSKVPSVREAFDADEAD